MLEAGAEVKVARVSETNDRVAADRILRTGFAMRHRAGRRHMAPEISAEPMAYAARRECLLLSDAGARDGRANFGDARTSGGLEEDVWRKAKFGIDALSQVLEVRRCVRLGQRSGPE